MADQETAEPATGAAADTQNQDTSSETDEQQQDNQQDETPDADVKAIAEALKKANREAEKHRRRARELEQQAEQKEQTVTERLATVERERDEARTQLLVFEVALEKRLPADLIPLLTGTSRDEIQAKADALSRHIKPSAATDFDGGAREAAPETKTAEEAHQELLAGLLTGRAPSR